MRNCLDVHLDQIVGDKDGVVDWSIVLVEIPLTRLKGCCVLSTESLAELPQNHHIVTQTLTIWPINSGVLTSLLLPQLSPSLTYSLASLNLLWNSKTDARFMQDSPKAVWSIPYVSVSFFLCLKQNCIAYGSSKVSSRPDCIFEIHQQWQSGFSRVYFHSFNSYSFEPEIIGIGKSSHKIYTNNILNFQGTKPILNACTKMSGNLLKALRTSFFLISSSETGLFLKK